MEFLGMPYPITRHPLGLLRTQRGVAQIKSDLLALLLTEPGERVMLPSFGTPLKRFMFEPNDPSLLDNVRNTIIESIRSWEPRIQVTDIQVTNSRSEIALSASPYDNGEDSEHVLLVRIFFTDFNNIQDIQQLKLQVPLGA
jgi:phage baseplate assembly protein W